MTPILQDRLPFAPWMDPRTARLPGIMPGEGGDWLAIDDAYAGQMAERDRLIGPFPGALSLHVQPASVQIGQVTVRAPASCGHR